MMARWAIVLAGGDGTRMQPMTEKCFGHPYPKQYCTFCGSRSMLEHTIDRAVQLVGSETLVTVVAEKHCSYFDENQLPGRILKQPFSRDTAVGVFYPLSHIRAEDSEATVLILPSDHFIYPLDRFIRQLREVFEIVEFQPELLALLGAKPTGPERDYGWIAPEDPREGLGPHDSKPFQNVLRFEEKPTSRKAQDYFSRGYLWNTMMRRPAVGTRMIRPWTGRLPENFPPGRAHDPFALPASF